MGYGTPSTYRALYCYVGVNGAPTNGNFYHPDFDNVGKTCVHLVSILGLPIVALPICTVPPVD